MKVKNKKTGKWVELPDPEPTERELIDMENRKRHSETFCAIHDAKDPWLRNIANERGY